MGLFLNALKKADNANTDFLARGEAHKHNPPRPQNTLSWQLGTNLIEDLTTLHENLEVRLEHKPHKVIAFASAIGNEGVSTVASYYAYFTANRVNLKFNRQNNSQPLIRVVKDQSPQVVLADLNFKNPQLHEFLGRKQHPGMVENVLDNLSLNRTLKNVNSSNFFLLSNGRAIANSISLLKSKKFRTFIGQVREHFDYAVLDTAPIIPHADSMTLANLIDGIVLVIRSGITRREIIQKAKAKLEEAGIPILGVVLNRRAYSIPNFIYKKL